MSFSDVLLSSLLSVFQFPSHMSSRTLCQLFINGFVVSFRDTGHHILTKTTVLNDATMFQAMENVTTVLQREFPSIRVLPLLGNHDWLPKNNLPQNSAPGDFYHQYADLFQKAGWLSENEANVFKKGKNIFLLKSRK